LIFIPDTPDTDENYYSSKEVIWKDVSNIFGKNRIYLEKYYSKEFRTFFVEKLGISEKPTPKDYADVLHSISKKNHISDEDKRIIIRIYEELNRNLNPDKVENPISNENWWNDFVKKPIFLTDKGEFWSNDGDIFINDNNELYKLFKGEEDIGFLWLQDGTHPDEIKFFIDACCLRYLSKSVEIEPLLQETTYLKNDEYTQLIQTITLYVLQYLFHKENSEYKKLKENGTLDKIGEIEVYAVDNLKAKYSIEVSKERTVTKEARRKCIYHKDKNRIYMESNGSIYDLAVEFSKAFGEIKGLDDFIMNIMSNPKNAKDIMRAKNIESLPESEKEILKKFSENKEREEKAEKEQRKVKVEASKEAEAERGKKPVEMKKTKSEKEETEKGISTRGILVETKEKEGIEISPEEAPIRVEKYTPEEVKEREITEKEVKSSDKKSVTKSQSTGDRTRSEGLSEEAKKIGRWGEKYAFRCIKDEMMKKYPDTSLKDTEQGFRLEKDGKVIVEVIWLNKNGESGQHYDIKITENGKEIFIEVKSTKEYGKTQFEVSREQWKFLKENGDKYYIYRVYGARTKNAKLEKIHNPAKLWKEEKIEAYPICIIL